MKNPDYPQQAAAIVERFLLIHAGRITRADRDAIRAIGARLAEYYHADEKRRVHFQPDDICTLA